TCPSRAGEVHALVAVSTAGTDCATPVPAASPWYTVQEPGRQAGGHRPPPPAYPLTAAQIAAARASAPATRATLRGHPLMAQQRRIGSCPFPSSDPSPPLTLAPRPGPGRGAPPRIQEKLGAS